jgi:hypothetical protein
MEQNPQPLAKESFGREIRKTSNRTDQKIETIFADGAEQMGLDLDERKSTHN